MYQNYTSDNKLGDEFVHHLKDVTVPKEAEDDNDDYEDDETSKPKSKYPPPDRLVEDINKGKRIKKITGHVTPKQLHAVYYPKEKDF